MKLLFEGQYKFNPDYMIRRCGYGQIVDGRTGKTSYARRFGYGLYPRFHVYIDKNENNFQVNLHLDQKQASYHGTSAHSGEYDGEKVEEEGKRIQSYIATMKIIV